MKRNNSTISQEELIFSTLLYDRAKALGAALGSGSDFNSYVKTCYELEKYDELINFIVNLENENKKDYFILGQAYEKIGEKEKAIEAYCLGNGKFLILSLCP